MEGYSSLFSAESSLSGFACFIESKQVMVSNHRTSISFLGVQEPQYFHNKERFYFHSLTAILLAWVQLWSLKQME